MKKLALSVAFLMVAAAGVSASAVGCSSSSSTSGDGGTTDSSTTGDDSGTGGDSATGDDSSTTGDSGTPADTGTTGEGGGDSGPACTGIGVVGTDGGENTACEQQIAANCETQQCDCVGDTNTIDDAGTPACGAFVLCVYQELGTLLATTDAGASADLATAMADCAGPDGGAFPASSIQKGQAFYTCLAGSGPTLAACLP